MEGQAQIVAIDLVLDLSEERRIGVEAGKQQRPADASGCLPSS
jgi:hypothetical protein